MKKSGILLVCLYVDYLIFIGNNLIIFDDFKEVMTQGFEMINISLMSYYLNIEVKQTKNNIFNSQEGYVK